MKRALISVSDKSGVIDFAKALIDQGWEIISTGGTAKALKEAGLDIISVSDVTGFPECLDGRVKTLHPMIFGGILNIRSNESHQKQCEELNITNIDLVCVNLYPFAEVVAKGSDFATCIENIDIGGPSLIRASAKNFNDVIVVTDPSDYDKVLDEIKEGGLGSKLFREKLALKAFEYTSHYDSIIVNYFRSQLDEGPLSDKITISFEKVQDLRYGENPHQQAAFYKEAEGTQGTLIEAEQLQGKELSYNNINDTNGALEILKEFTDEPTVVAVKHANPCAIASDTSIAKAYEKAYEADPTSIFGGIVAANGTIEAETARQMVDIFLEVVVAPDYTDEALEIFKEKPNLRVLKLEDILSEKSGLEYKSVMGGLLVQNRDADLIDELVTVTEREPTEKEWEDLMFAWKAVKNTKSNAISLVKDKTLIANGPGQVNRVWPTKYSIMQAGDKVYGSVLASDAFFPFDDCVKLAAENGVTAIIQPGGSIRDEDSIKICNNHNIAMVFTGMRHFKHS